MNAPEGLLAERVEGVLVLTIDRPAVANAINSRVYLAFCEHLARAAQDSGTAGVVLAGAGERTFSAGADLKETFGPEIADPPAYRRSLLMQTLEMALDFPKPFVCAVQSKALGAGWMIALCADEVVATAQASFGMPEMRHGMPTPIGVALLAAHAPGPAVRKLVQFGQPITAEEALRLGYADHLVPATELRAQAVARVRAAAALSPAAYAGNKRWLNRALRAELGSAAMFAGELHAAAHPRH